MGILSPMRRAASSSLHGHLWQVRLHEKPAYYEQITLISTAHALPVISWPLLRRILARRILRSHFRGSPRLHAGTQSVQICRGERGSDPSQV